MARIVAEEFTTAFNPTIASPRDERILGVSGVRIEVAGIEYGDFVAASAELRLDALANSFSFEATSKDGLALPFRGGEACKITVDGERVITGFIELVNVTGSGDEHRIDIQGRDRTADLVDSTIGALDDIGTTPTLKRIIEKVIAHIDPDTLPRNRIQVIDLAGAPAFNEAEDLEAPEHGQGAFEFIEKLARKRQVLLTSDGNGNVVITRSSGQTINAFIHHERDDDANNVISYAVSRDQTGRFNLYQSISQLNMVPLNNAGDVSVDSIVSQGASKRTVDDQIRQGRQRILSAEAPASDAEVLTRAEWQKNIDRARGRVYSCVLHGHRDQRGELWALNTLPFVDDDFAAIHDRMLVNTVRFGYSLDEGKTTSLSLVEKNAYDLALEEPENEEEGGL